jgi:hypothetical protein
VADSTVTRALNQMADEYEAEARGLDESERQNPRLVA